MPPKDGDQYNDLPMYIVDQDGTVQEIPRPLPEIKSGELYIEGDDQPEFILPPKPQKFSFTAKSDREFFPEIRKEMNHRKRLIRNIARKKERFRKAVLKYGVTDRKAQLAFLLYEVAVLRLTIWREEAKHGYAKVPERSRTKPSESAGRR